MLRRPLAPRVLIKLRHMAAKQSKPYQTFIHEILERAVRQKVAERVDATHPARTAFYEKQIPLSIHNYGTRVVHRSPDGGAPSPLEAHSPVPATVDDG